MAELDQRHNLAVAAGRHLDVRAALERTLGMHDQAFTSWRLAGQESARFGLVLDHNREDQALRLLECRPDSDPCPACGRHPAKQRVNVLTVPEADITEIRALSHSARVGWANKLLSAAIDGNSITSDRGRQLVGWAVTLGRDPR